MELAIETTGLVKRYKSVVALNGVDLAVPRGIVLGPLGPNGAGKTTAVRVLPTLLRADEGQAWSADWMSSGTPAQFGARSACPDSTQWWTSTSPAMRTWR